MLITNNTLKAPIGNAFMAEAWQTCQAKNPEDLAWGETGPRLLRALVPQLGLTHAVAPPHAFCPIEYGAWAALLDAERTWDFDATTYAVHLWNEMWRRAGQDKNASYPPQCLYEQLKARYLR